MKTTETGVAEPRTLPLSKRLAWGALVGLLCALIAFALSFVWIFRSFELRTLDLRQKLLATPRPAVDQVGIVLIDEFSVRELRRKERITWPWPREVYQAIVRYLKEAGAKSVVFDLVFADPWPQRKFDAQLAKAMKDSGNVTLAMKLDSWERSPEEGLDEEGAAVARGRVTVKGWSLPLREGLRSLVTPIPEFIAAAARLGCVNVKQDADNTLRRVDLVFPYPEPGTHLPFLGLAAALPALGDPGEMHLEDRELVVASRRIPLGDDGRLLVRYYGPEQTFLTVNAASVARSAFALEERRAMEEEKRKAQEERARGEASSEEPAEVAEEEELPEISVPLETFRDRVVFLGVNIAGMEDVVPVPTSVRLPGVEFQATVAANILGGDFLRELPGVQRLIVLAALGIASGLIAFVLWRPVRSGLTLLAVLLGYGALAFAAFRGGVVLELFFPAGCLAGVFLAQTLLAYLTEGRAKREVSRAFGQYLSADVIRDLLENPDALKLGGETREVTVHFSDIKAFSTFSEKLGSEELVSFLNVYLSAMTDVILDHRGVLDKYIGDAIVAFWGAPVPVENGALEACLAVVENRKALPALNDRFEAQGLPRIEFRTGLHTGPATVGNMGSTRRFAYTAMGNTVNLASRLEGANKFFATNVMMSAAVRDRASDGIVARRLGRIRVVGISEPVLVYELLGAKGDLSVEDKKRLERFHEALGLLEGGQPGNAAAAFEGLLSEKADPPIEVFLRKARELAAGGTSWDGVWVLKEKG